jgi:hypothetical protein
MELFHNSGTPVALVNIVSAKVHSKIKKPLRLVKFKKPQKNKTLNKHLTSKLQVSPNFTLDSVADSNYRGRCDVGDFLIFEWTSKTSEIRPFDWLIQIKCSISSNQIA